MTRLATKKSDDEEDIWSHKKPSDFQEEFVHHVYHPEHHHLIKKHHAKKHKSHVYQFNSTEEFEKKFQKTLKKYDESYAKRHRNDKAKKMATPKKVEAPKKVEHRPVKEK